MAMMIGEFISRGHAAIIICLFAASKLVQFRGVHTRKLSACYFWELFPVWRMKIKFTIAVEKPNAENLNNNRGWEIMLLYKYYIKFWMMI